MRKIASIAALAGLLFGFDTGIISGAIVFIQDSFYLNTWMTEVVVSIVLLGALIGALFSSKLVNQIGRRSAIGINALIFMMSTLCCAFAPTLMFLLIGRFAVGLAIGVACYVVPLYISELSPARFRGGLVAINTIAVTGGILISYITSCFLSPSEDWRWMLGIGFFPAAALLIGIRYLPESPRWLIKKGDFAKASAVLKQIRQSPKEAEQEFQMIKEAIKEPQHNWRELFQPKHKKVLIIGVVLAAIQQVTGINTILYYAPLIFHRFGFQSTSAQMLLTTAVGLINFLLTIVVMLRVDKVGRRNLLLIGLAGMTVSLFLLGIGHNPILVLASLFTFVAFYASSIGSIFWIVIAEIYPLNIRGLAMGIASGANWGSNLLMSLTFLSLLNAIGPNYTFLCYSFLSLLSFLFCYKWLPETARYSLEDLERGLHRPDLAQQTHRLLSDTELSK
ncbi:MAG: sugar porter family MFS transporter [Verrucomicrobia bacterium]|nr:sugar porter family MFS transporter [Verrucomicrobiota bacterium]